MLTYKDATQHNYLASLKSIYRDNLCFNLTKITIFVGIDTNACQNVLYTELSIVSSAILSQNHFWQCVCPYHLQVDYKELKTYFRKNYIWNLEFTTSYLH